ncbi:MAG TPA: glycoside hydrolase family 16 protein [Cytophagales bacterium]|jgi:beta-glucanase (GH16 family)
MKTIGIMALLLATLGAWKPWRRTPGPAAEAPALKLVWADEFDRDGPPDPAKWTFERGFVRNEELQYYQPGNAFCANGHLVIEARRDSVKNPAYDPASPDWRRNRPYARYTAASLTTQGLHQWQYGRFEMRARIDTRPGMWPAFWTLGVAGEWPASGEIDIMEYYRGDLLANAAWGTRQRYEPKWSTTKKPITSFGDPQWSRKFHVWRMDWDRQFIKLYVDNQLLNAVALDTTVNGDAAGKNPFRQPHYLLLSLAVGGTNGGDPAQTPFPARLEVDYIRVYQ